MHRLKKNVGPLLDRSIESLTLAIEIFNRPSEIARTHAVLILLQHSFELLLKALILEKTGRVHEPDGRFSYSFARCLTVATEELKALTPDERSTLAILDAQRDQAAHYYAEVSEDLLYIHAQSAVTLYDKFLRKSFSVSLGSRMPTRILPVSSQPPRDLVALFDEELAEVDRLLELGKRRGAKAAARLRSVLAFATGAREESDRVSEDELSDAIARRRHGEAWEVILPEITQLRLSTDGSGVPISMRISKDAPAAVRIAKPGEDAVGSLLKQEVNLWDKFNMSRDDLAEKLALSGPRTHALIYELAIQDDDECYRELKRKRQIFKGYSHKALDRLRDGMKTLNLDEVWQRQKHRFGAGARKKNGH
jgi:hypothetical protein